MVAKSHAPSRRSSVARAATAAEVVATLAVVACAGSGAAGDPVRPDPAARTVEGVTYEGELLVMESFPVQLAGRVTVTNAGNEVVTLTFRDRCLVLLRAYRDGEIVWDQGANVLCAQAVQPLTLEPGESETLRAPTVSAYEVLAGGLPDGDYRMAARLHPGRADVELDLGEIPLAIPRATSELE